MMTTKAKTKYFCYDKEGNLSVVTSHDCVPPNTETVIYVDEDHDSLSTMLAIQLMFQKRLGSLPNNSKESTDYISHHAQYANAELHEMLRELEYFKDWKTYGWSEEEKALHLVNAKEEFIDALHFILNIAIALKLTSVEILDIFVKKNEVNHTRQDSGY